MRIEVFGDFNEGGSSMPLSVYEISAECERVLIAPHQKRSHGGPVWGFLKDGTQVEGVLVEHEPSCVITG